MQRQAILIINGVPCTFPKSFIETETYALGSSLQMPTEAGGMPIITPSFRTTSITVKLPMDDWKNKLAYKSARHTIRLAQFMFAQRNEFIRRPIEDPAVDVSPKRVYVPFTNVAVPWQIQISCAYFGINAQLACCILDSFSISTNPAASNVETWTISLTEYDISELRANPKQKIQHVSMISAPNEFVRIVK